MKCTSCKRNIAAGVEAQKMVVEYQQDDGTSKFFGFMMQDGPISAATGRILRAWHHKHYHAARKRESRGDIVTGRVLNGSPTAYEMAAIGLDPADAAFVDTRQYSDRLARLHELARSVGKAVGDVTVLEAYWGEQNGSPYEHGHQFRLEPYQLRAHLRYAHGVSELPSDINDLHSQLHARMQAAAIARIRTTEKERETPDRDWREHLEYDVPRP